MSGPCTDCGGPDYQTLVARVAELGAENQAIVARVAEGRLDGYRELAQKLNKAEAVAVSSDHLLLETTQWAKDERQRAEQAEAEVAKRDDFIDSLYSESGIPTRHWRDRITQYVADLRASSVSRPPPD